MPKELVPQTVIDDWATKCDPKLLPSVERDYERIRNDLFRDKHAVNNDETKLYMATAGAPCAGKSTELDREISSGGDPRYANAVIIDPDRYTMPYMFTYQNFLSAGHRADLGQDASRQAYDFARPGSNVIANRNLNQAFNDDHHIVHGTTLTTAFAGKFLKTLGDAGYERRLMLCYAPDQVRTAALEKRGAHEGNYQVTPADFVEKGYDFPKRHQAYFEHADNLVLLWKPELEQHATKAREYKHGQAKTLDQAAYDAYTEKYEQDRFALSKKNEVIPSWDKVENQYFKRFLSQSKAVEHNQAAQQIPPTQTGSASGDNPLAHGRPTSMQIKQYMNLLGTFVPNKKIETHGNVPQYKFGSGRISYDNDSTHFEQFLNSDINHGDTNSIKLREIAEIVDSNSLKIHFRNHPSERGGNADIQQLAGKFYKFVVLQPAPGSNQTVLHQLSRIADYAKKHPISRSVGYREYPSTFKSYENIPSQQPTAQNQDTGTTQTR